MPLMTEYEFTLPKGYIDSTGTIHRKGIMRLATAADEIIPMRDPRVQQNPAYLSIILLSRVVVRLGTLTEVRPDMIECLFTQDMKFLQDMYTKINAADEPTMEVVCPACGNRHSVALNFTREA